MQGCRTRNSNRRRSVSTWVSSAWCVRVKVSSYWFQSFPKSFQRPVYQIQKAPPSPSGEAWAGQKCPGSYRRLDICFSGSDWLCLTLQHAELGRVIKPPQFPHDPLPGSPLRGGHSLSFYQLAGFEPRTEVRQVQAFTTWTPLTDSTTDFEALNNLGLTPLLRRRPSVSIELKDGSTIRNRSQLQFLIYPKSHIFNRLKFFICSAIHSFDRLSELLALIHGYLWWYWWIILYYSHSFEFICFVMCWAVKIIRYDAQSFKNFLVHLLRPTPLQRWGICCVCFGLLHKYQGLYMRVMSKINFGSIVLW